MLKPEFIRFVCAGVANTAFSYVLYLLFNLVVPYKLAYTLSYILGVGISYWLNSTWVYKVVMSLKTFLQFPIVYVVQYVINIVSLHILVERFSVDKNLAPFFIIVLSVPVTFVLSRWIIVRKVSSSSSA